MYSSGFQREYLREGEKRRLVHRELGEEDVSRAVCVTRLHYITLHYSYLADTFIQSDLQLIRLRKGQSPVGQCRVKGLVPEPNICGYTGAWTPKHLGPSQATCCRLRPYGIGPSPLLSTCYHRDLLSLQRCMSTLSYLKNDHGDLPPTLRTGSLYAPVSLIWIKVYSLSFVIFIFITTIIIILSPLQCKDWCLKCGSMSWMFVLFVT